MATTASSTSAASHDETIDRYGKYVTTSFVAAIEPVVVGRAEGATVWDVDGTEYVDCFAGIAVVNAGHRHPKVIAAVKAQLDKVVHAATYIYHVPVVGLGGERLAEIAPAACRRPSSATPAPRVSRRRMRLAKAYTGKHEFITLTHSFHGRTDGTLSITGNKARKTRGGPYLPGVAFAPAPYIYRNPFGTDDPEEVAERCADMVEWAIDLPDRAAMSPPSSPSRCLGRGRHPRAARVLLPAGQGDPRPSRHPLHLRRGAIRLRALRQDVRHRALRGRAGHHGRWPRASPTASP